MNNSSGKIKSLADFNRARQELKVEIKNQESEILNSPIFTIPAALFNAGSVKDNLQDSFGSISLHDYRKAAISLLSTALMANRKTRKFFVGFIIAKEMVPFILDKLNEFLKK